MQDYIDRLYRELLGRPVGPADMEAGRWAGHPESTVRTGILNSDEYRNRQGSSSSSGFMHGFSASSSAMDGLAKLQEEIQRKMWEIYQQHQLPYEQEVLNYMKEMLPAQHGLATETLGYQRELLPVQHQHAMQSLQGQIGLLPLQNEFAEEVLRAQLGLMPLESQDARETLEARMQLRPYQTRDQKEALEASMHLRPHQTREELDRIAARGEVRGFGLEGVDINRRVGQAVADSQHAGDAQADAARRQLESMGINPGSGAYVRMFRDQANDAMLNRSHAMNQARWSGEDDDWQRKLDAARL